MEPRKKGLKASTVSHLPTSKPGLSFHCPKTLPKVGAQSAHHSLTGQTLIPPWRPLAKPLVNNTSLGTLQKADAAKEPCLKCPP